LAKKQTYNFSRFVTVRESSILTDGETEKYPQHVPYTVWQHRAVEYCDNL